MLKVSGLYTGIRLQVILWQCFVNLLRHLHIAIMEASFNQKEKEVELRTLNVLGFEFSDHLQYLHKSEVLFSVVLHPQSSAPHVNPSYVHVGPFSSTYIRNVNLLSLEEWFEGWFTLSTILCLQFVLEIWGEAVFLEDIRVLVKQGIQNREYRITITFITLLI